MVKIRTVARTVEENIMLKNFLMALSVYLII